MVVYPVPVQGAQAAPAIVRALATAGERAECDVLILARGGGSLEDLQAFNEESVARAVVACPIPVVSGVGHEIDFTIADFAADHRAPTPSAAAELVTPDMAAWLQRLRGVLARLDQRATLMLRTRRERVSVARRRLRDPRRRLDDASQRLDSLSLRLARQGEAAVAERRRSLDAVLARLRNRHPERDLVGLRERQLRLRAALHAGARRQLQPRRLKLDALLRALEAVGPRATLARGYSIVSRAEDGAIVRSAGTLVAGERARLTFVDGGVDARILGDADVEQGKLDL